MGGHSGLTFEPGFAMGTASLNTPEPPRNSQKVSKRSSRASPLGVSKKSPNTDFDTFLTLFGSFGTFSTLF